ncbi:UNVERIFIED_CONTAM: Paraplegin, partial [Eudyptes robustus]
QIKRYGFSTLVGPLSFASEPGQERSEQFQRKPYSKQLGNIMDSEARELVKQAYYTTEKLLNDNKDKLDLLA